MKVKLVLIFLGICVLLISIINNKNNAKFSCNEFMNDKITTGTNGKIAVLIHGYPEPIYEDNPLFTYFTDNGYTVIAPYLFSPKFKLNNSEVIEYIKKELGDKKPDVIAGLSLGGLIAPSLAKEYPEAKLLLIGTGPYVRPNLALLNGLLTTSTTPAFDLLYRAFEKIPTPLYSFVYKIFNHPVLTTEQKLKLNEHIVKNWNCLKSISESEDKEVINFLTSVDNTELLKNLKNKTLIFAADEDNLMPKELAVKLNTFIKGSKLVISSGRIHYNVFDDENYSDLSTFLID